MLAMSIGGILTFESMATLQARDNIALDRPYTLSHKGNYELCTDPDDVTQLTDGAYSPPGRRSADGLESPNIWSMESAVGWVDVSPVIIEIDLGNSQPISGISFSTAARLAAGVEWPKKLLIFVSDDGSNWRFLGDLMTLSAVNGKPPETGRYRFATNDLHAKGQYVSVAFIPSTRYAFCDEIEIYSAPNTVPDQTGPTTDDLREFIKSH